MANNTAIYLRLSTDLKVKLQDLSKQHGHRKFSEIVRQALEEYIEKHSEKVTA